jgi:putative endonuclease
MLLSCFLQPSDASSFIPSRKTAHSPVRASTMQVKKASGDAAEHLAADYLTRHGLRVLERNWRVRGGEIDLICRDGEMLVFVEVRLRGTQDFGGAAASITPAKQRRIVCAARHYLAGKREQPCRFDVILLDRLDPARLEWLRHAFLAE